jgi:acetyltransferase-like isoleucine patch superfamily enzyme
MRPVTVPTTDVNSEYAVLVEWLVADGAPVRRGEPVAEVETSKSVIEVDAPSDGFLLHAVSTGADFELAAPIAHLFDTLDDLERRRRDREAARHAPTAHDEPGHAYRATRSAEALAIEHGIDLSTVGKTGLITSADVEALIAATRDVDPSSLPAPLEVAAGQRRVVLLGGGLGATQVIDILSHDGEQEPVAVLDDDRERWGEHLDGIPIVGGTERLESLHEDGLVDAAIVAISTSIPARTRLRELCHKYDVPLTNAIDPTARLASGVQLGQGNVICAFCHFGVGTIVGDNNFLSAYNSFDHHSTLGSDISTGPGCMTSGLVTVGDRVRLGTGIFVEPKVEIADDVIVASGAVLVRSVPAGHVVKTRAGTNVVSPRRP